MFSILGLAITQLTGKTGVKKSLNLLFVSFTAGLISAAFLFFIATLVMHHGTLIINAEFKQQLYKLMVWGGIWAILLVIPKPKGVLIRGSILGIIVILFNFIILFPAKGYGLFGIHAPLQIVLMNIVFNYLWGVIAALIQSAAKLKS